MFRLLTCVMTSGEVISGVFFAADELFRVEELAVGTGTDLVDDGGFQVDKHCSRDVFPGAGFAEEGVEGVVAASDGFVTGHLSVGLKAMFETVELPAGVSDLDSGLTDVD